MKFTTISIKEQTKKELKNLKILYNTNSMDTLLRLLIAKERQTRMNDFSKEFQRRLEERNLTLEDILKSGEEIRNEILKERKLI